MLTISSPVRVSKMSTAASVYETTKLSPVIDTLSMQVGEAVMSGRAMVCTSV
jgi:hypothetical protein